MASALQELRKAAGYRTAKEFADEMGIPTTSYSRYESAPGKISVDQAWRLADRLGCSIDLIVGRADLDAPESGAGDLRGPVQRLYDGLSPRLRESLDDYLAYLVARNADEERRREAERIARVDLVRARLEQLFLAQLDAGDAGIAVFASPADLRRAFAEYVSRRAAERGEPELSGHVGEIMGSYDRAHGQAPARGRVELAVVDLGRSGAAEDD